MTVILIGDTPQQVFYIPINKVIRFNKNIIMHKGKLLVFVILTTLTFLTGCRKSRFQKFENIIEILIPEDCNYCAVYIGKNRDGNKDILVEEFEAYFSNYSVFDYNITASGNRELKIDWSERPYFDPTDKLRFLLVDEGGIPGVDGYSSGGRKMIMQNVKKLKPRGWYTWHMGFFPGEGTQFNEFDKKVPKPEGNTTFGGGEPSNPLSGKWSQIGGCNNTAGERNYFNFSSSNSGEIGQIDCADACIGGGVYTQFDYSISGNDVTITVCQSIVV